MTPDSHLARARTSWRAPEQHERPATRRTCRSRSQRGAAVDRAAGPLPGERCRRRGPAGAAGPPGQSLLGLGGALPGAADEHDVLVEVGRVRRGAPGAGPAARCRRRGCARSRTRPGYGRRSAGVRCRRGLPRRSQGEGGVEAVVLGGHAVVSCSGRVGVVTGRPAGRRCRSVSSMATTSRPAGGEQAGGDGGAVAAAAVHPDLAGGDLVEAAEQFGQRDVTRRRCGRSARSLVACVRRGRRRRRWWRERAARSANVAAGRTRSGRRRPTAAGCRWPRRRAGRCRCGPARAGRRRPARRSRRAG